MLSRNRLCLLDRKIHDKSPDHIFDMYFLQYDPYNYLSRVCSKFFDLSCRSSSKKFFSLCCSIFLSFCPCLLFADLQSLSLLFLCKIFWAGKRNSNPSWKSLFAVEENYFSRALTSLISLQ